MGDVNNGIRIRGRWRISIRLVDMEEEEYPLDRWIWKNEGCIPSYWESQYGITFK